MWPNLMIEFSRMLFKSITNNVVSVTLSIIILEHPIVIGIREDQKQLLIITEQLNI